MKTTALGAIVAALALGTLTTESFAGSFWDDGSGICDDPWVLCNGDDNQSNSGDDTQTSTKREVTDLLDEIPISEELKKAIRNLPSSAKSSESTISSTSRGPTPNTAQTDPELGMVHQAWPDDFTMPWLEDEDSIMLVPMNADGTLNMNDHVVFLPVDEYGSLDVTAPGERVSIAAAIEITGYAVVYRNASQIGTGDCGGCMKRCNDVWVCCNGTYECK